MTGEQIVLAEIRKNLAGLDEDTRIKIEAIAQTLRGIVRLGGDEARFALALIGAEMAAQS